MWSKPCNEKILKSEEWRGSRSDWPAQDRRESEGAGGGGGGGGGGVGG